MKTKGYFKYFHIFYYIAYSQKKQYVFKSKRIGKFMGVITMEKTIIILDFLAIILLSISNIISWCVIIKKLISDHIHNKQISESIERQRELSKRLYKW